MNFVSLMTSIRICHSPCINPSSRGGEAAEGYIGALVLTKRSDTLTHTLAMLFAPISGPVPPHSLGLTLVLAVFVAMYTNKNL